jgi:hypothetical protein
MTVRPDFSFSEGNVDYEAADFYQNSRMFFGRATMLPRHAYTSDNFQLLENEKVWTRAWVCVGTTFDIGDAGDLLPYTIGQHAIHVQRQPDDRLIGRFNKAQHGGCRSVPAQCRTGKKTKCSYTSCGHSRDRGVIPGSVLGEMSPLMGQYLGAVPERLIPVRVSVSGNYIFANVDPDEAGGAQPPSMPAEIRAGQRHGLWREHRSNWKLAGATLVDVARTDIKGGAMNHVDAAWFFPNLVLIRSQTAVASVVLQPTAMDRTLWRISLFAPASTANFGAMQTRFMQLLDRAAERATAAQSMVEQSTTEHIVETTRSGWRFNQQLIDQVTRRHSTYWNAPLVDATVAVSP